MENSIKAKNEFKLALQLFPKKKSNWNPQVLTCSSITGDGLADIWDCINDYVSLTKKNNYFYDNRVNQNKSWLLQIIDYSLRKSFFNRKSVKLKLDNLIKKVEEQKISIFEASQKILSEI